MWQAAADIGGRFVLDLASGTTPDGAPVTPLSLVPWASAIKPVTVAAVLRLVDEGAVRLDDPVTKFIPAFAAHGKSDVLVWHLMTHSAHLGGYGGPVGLPPWNRVIDRIAAAPREPARALRQAAGAPPAPGTVPAYNPAGIWILGEILVRLRRKPFAEAIRHDILLPCGMTDCWVGLSSAQAKAYGARAATLAQGPLAFLGRPNPVPVERLDTQTVNPAGGGVGPCGDLARFYRMLLAGGRAAAGRVLSSAIVAEMGREWLTDGKAWSWGLGVNLNRGPGGERRFGTRASPRAFGHAGASGMVAFADPVTDLALAIIPGPGLVDLAVDDALGRGKPAG
jgi:CubicO group peptidase (beta-lactamase class C family)